MEEIMYWCPCQLAMKNNVEYEEDEMSLRCDVIDMKLYMKFIDEDDPNWLIDKGIHNACKKHCEYYHALAGMFNDPWYS